VRGLGETVERQMVESLKITNMKGDEPPSAEKRFRIDTRTQKLEKVELYLL